MSGPGLQATLDEARLTGGVGAALKALLREPVHQRLAREQERVSGGATLVHLGDAAYPERLLDLEDPPVFLSVQGALEAYQSLVQVAIVGSRKASFDDAEFTERMARELAEADVGVVSGGALGVDAAAHRGCLNGRGRTSAVLPGGLNRLTPRSHRALFEDILRGGGALISEYPADVSAKRYHFHRRNRIIAALARGVVIVKAESKSGTMLTARAAQELERSLLVVPGAVDDPLAMGCLELLVGGARAVRHGRDVLRTLQLGEEEWGRARPDPRAQIIGGSGGRELLLDERRALRVAPEGLSPEGRRIFEGFARFEGEGMEVVHIDELARALEVPIAELGHPLVELELSGWVARVSGAQAYRLCH